MVRVLISGAAYLLGVVCGWLIFDGPDERLEPDRLLVPLAVFAVIAIGTWRSTSDR